MASTSSESFANARAANRRCRGMARRDAIITIALLAVIGVSLWITWRNLFGGSRVVPPEVRDFGFQCSQCKHEFIATNVELNEMVVDEEALQQFPTRFKLDPHCPKCSAKHTGKIMQHCPACGTYFMHSTVNLRTDSAATIPPNPVCPKCKTDIMEWYRKNRAE